MMRDFITILVLGIAAFWDLRERKIPNFLTLPAMALGLLINLVSGGTNGLLDALKGLAGGVGLLLLPFVLGGMGGGDVKLLGAVGALQGLTTLLHSALYAGVSGGVLCMLALGAKGRLLLTLKKSLSWLFLETAFRLMSLHPALIPYRPAKPQDILAEPSSVRVAYGVAIGIGTFLAILTKGHPLW